jgi:Tol biopolymer transport system component
VLAFAWAPDGSRIAYTADQVADGVVELFTSLPDGTGNVKVSGSLVPGGNSLRPDFFWAPNSTRIAFVADKLTLGQDELFTVPGDGSTAPVKVSGAMVGGGDINAGSTDVAWSPDSTRIVYFADQELNNARGVFVTLAASESSTRVSPAPVAGDQAFSPAWTPDSTRVVFHLDSAGTSELRIAPVAGPSLAVVPAPHSFPLRNVNPFSFAGDRIVVEFKPGDVAPFEIHSFLVSTLAETVVATPGLDVEVDEFE